MKIFTVSEFISLVNETLKALSEYQQFAVEGEISGYRVNQGQWVTFDLKDGTSVVNIFTPIWKVRVPLEDGMQVRVIGVARVYAKYGKFSLSADQIELVGEGALRKALALLRAKLEKEGLFDVARKREFPRFPRRIALIASRDSAAYGDFVRVSGERWPLLTIDLYHVLVQGEKAPGEIRAALSEVHKRHAKDPYDAVVITRGGGSFEELMAFNDEGLVRDIFASKIPTLVAVGHERDLTLAEEVADVRGATPTDAARRLVPDSRDIEYELASVLGGISNKVEHRVKEKKFLIHQVLHSSITWLATFQERLNNTVRLLKSLDPKAVMNRGYSIVTDMKGSVIGSVRKLSKGQAVQLRLKDGSAATTIQATQPK